MDTPDDRPDGPPDRQTDTSAATRWMTFAELAHVRGISKDSAVTLVRRHGWRRQRDNQGHVIALVPLTWATPDGDGQPDDRGDRRSDSPPDSRGDVAAFEAALAAVREAKDGEIATLRATVARSVALIDGFRAERDQAQQALVDERARADAADADRRSAQSRADAAIARADSAEARADHERDRADAERTQADALKGLLEATQQEIAQQRALTDQADDARQRAEDSAEALRQADEARKARGRWARLRAAWRGE
jgi:hypothetical protein